MKWLISNIAASTILSILILYFYCPQVEEQTPLAYVSTLPSGDMQCGNLHTHFQSMNEAISEGYSMNNSSQLYCLPKTNTNQTSKATLVHFPIRVAIVVQPYNSQYISRQRIEKSVQVLNDAFEGANIGFHLEKIDTIYHKGTIQDYLDGEYIKLKMKYQKDNMINLFLIDDNYCEADEVICSMKKGFAETMSEYNKSLFITKSAAVHPKVLPHEFGHFFGLKHTFEKGGDGIDDTPTDPGDPKYLDLFLNTWIMDPNGEEADPLIENYMNYYPPGYMLELSFTKGQMKVINNHAHQTFSQEISIPNDLVADK